ncbi:MAG: sugar ABC transporter permease [Chloroflexi bacterium]|nr:sugar ABC transporter permease [Chloroflexota bacterium]
MTTEQDRSPVTRRGSGSSRRPSRDRRDALILLGPCILYLFAFSIFPLLYSLRNSFTDLGISKDSGNWVGLDNYVAIFNDPFFWNAAGNTAVMVGAAVVVQVVLGTALALFMNQKLRGSWFVRGALILPMLLTPIVVGVMWRAMLNPDWGIVNWIIKQLGMPPINWLGSTEWSMRTLVIADTWQWTPFVFLIVYARLQGLPGHVLEAAQVDGAGRWATFRNITLPLLAPAIAFAAIFRAIDAFRSFDLVFGLTYGGPARSTTTLSFLTYQSGFQFQQYGYSAAIAYVMVVILIVASTVTLRFVRTRGVEGA